MLLVPIPICRPESGPCGGERKRKMKKKKLYKKALWLMADNMVDSCLKCPVRKDGKACEPFEDCDKIIARYWIDKARKGMS